VIENLEPIVGAPVELEQLRDEPGRWRELRASGPVRNAIVKLYAGELVEKVASRVAAVSDGPPEVAVPRVVLTDPALDMVVLSEVKGDPLTGRLLAGDAAACRCAGAAVGLWHRAWVGSTPQPLRPHGVERELKTLDRHAKAASPELAAMVRRAAADLGEPWDCTTVVHRDLSDEHILVGERIGLIDLDHAALGPPELDAGNLMAHVDLLSLRSGRDLAAMSDEFRLGYEGFDQRLDEMLLDRCRRLARLRLACIHDEPRLTHRPNHLNPVGA
jgi:Phosphotransferase enzyme family